MSSSLYAQLPNLSTGQRNLLLAALSSNKRGRASGTTDLASGPLDNYTPTQKAQISPVDAVNPAIFDINQESFSIAGYDSTFDDSLVSSYGETGAFDFGSAGSAFQLQNNAENEHEKRKSPDDEEEDDEDDEAQNKRQEGDDKVAKKPGRKLIVAEPTTKRKAQNRAAQRAFRDRKEKHLKDLEVKVDELEKVTEKTSSENGVLRAQIDRLQSELASYKKRLASNSGLSGSPPSAALPNFTANSSVPSATSDFQFDFTKFGQPAAFRQMSSTSSTSNTNAQTRHNSRSLSPQHQDSMTSSWTGGSSSGIEKPDATTAFFNSFNDVGNVNFDAVPNTTMPCPSLCHSETRSSGCSPAATTPENPYANYTESPAALPELGMSQTAKVADPLAFDFSGTFGDDQGFNQFIDTSPNGNFDFGIDYLANQNGGQFDPVLFNDYRETQDAIIGAGDFSGGFFDDTFTMPTNFNFDLSPQATTLSQLPVSAPKQSLMDQVDACRNGDVGENDGLATLPPNMKEMAQRSQMMTAHKVWTELQSCPKFKSGELDIDSLCSELSKKATCSETGLQIPKDVVEATLWKLAGDDKESGKLMSDIYSKYSKQS